MKKKMEPPKMVIWVDDDRWEMSGYLERLELEGLNVCFFTEPESAERRITQSPSPDLAIVDLIMRTSPTESAESTHSAGVTLCKKIRMLKGPNFPIVVLTVVTDQAPLAEVKSIASAVVNKGILPGELVAILQRFLHWTKSPLLALVFWLTGLCFAEGQNLNQNQMTTNLPQSILSLESYKALIESQSAMYRLNLETQQKIAEHAIEASRRSYETIQAVLVGGSLIVGILATLFGAWIAIIFKSMKKRSADSSNKVLEMESSLQNIKKEMESCLKGLSYAQKVKEELDRLGKLDELLSETEERAELASWRIRIMSGDPQEQERAIQAVAQLGKARAVPLLLDCVRDGSRPISMLAEALYGLGRVAKLLSDDAAAVRTILETSRHSDKAIRLASIKVMLRIGVKNALIESRLKEMRESEKDHEVQTEARHALQDSGA